MKRFEAGNRYVCRLNSMVPPMIYDIVARFNLDIDNYVTMRNGHGDFSTRMIYETVRGRIETEALYFPNNGGSIYAIDNLLVIEYGMGHDHNQ